MKNITKHIGKVENLERLPSSSNGNPRYKFNIDGYTVCTATDCMLGYEIKNLNGANVEVTIGQHYGKLTLNTIKRT